MTQAHNEAIYKGFDHLVFLTSDLAGAVAFWSSQLPVHTQVSLPEHKAEQVFLTLADESFVEILAPTDDTSPVAGLLAEHGEGLYVVAMQVEDLEQAQTALKARGAALVGEGTDRVFVRPETSGEPLVQLWPKNRPHRWRDEQQQEHAS